VLGGTPAVNAQHTSFVASECVLLSPFGAAAIAYNAHFEAARTFFTSTGQPALRLFDCVSRLASDGSTAMTVLGPGIGPVAALETIGGSLQFEPATVGLTPFGSAPPYQTLNTVVRLEEVPTLTASPAPPGQTASVRMSCSVPRVGVVVLGELRDAPLFFDLSTVWIDTALAPLLLAGGVCDPTGLASQVPIPNLPALRGEAFALQGITWLPNGGPVLSAAGLWIML